MAKQSRELRATKTHDSAKVEHREVFDDNLLPEAYEIEKLHIMDPNILPWLKERAEKEQDFRHQAYNNRITITETKNCREHNTVRYAISIYFVLVLICVSASFLLIQADKNIAGSLFGGTGVILSLAVLLTKTKEKESSKEGH